MKIVLPEAAKGFKFDLLSTIDMNDFDVEMLLPMLFHMVRTKGSPVGKANDPLKFDVFFDRLVQNEHVSGFEDARSRKLLKRWVRTSVVKMGRVGRSARGEQILFVFPRTMLAYKAGLPKDTTRLRGTHRFLYRILLEETKDPVELESLFTASFGEGVAFGPGPQYDGRYDGNSGLDLETLLSLCFLDALTPAGVGHRISGDGNPGPKLAAQSSVIAKDVLALLRCYRNEISTTLLIGMLGGLINLHLFVYTMRLTRWVIGVVDQQTMPRAHKFYVDTTGERQSYSDELARSCVEGDLGELEIYMRAALRLKTLDRYIRSSAKLKAQLPSDISPGDRLRMLVDLQHSPEVEIKSELEFEDVLKLNTPDSEEDQTTDAAQFLDTLATQQFEWSLDRMLEVIFKANRDSALANLGSWFYSVAGFNRSYGVMSGNMRGVRVARYTLSNELLSVLVHVALAAAGSDGKPASRMPLRRFLKILEERYGILIDKPPSFDTSVEAAEAARRNLIAFKIRLRQIGVFQSLSDDFGAQFVQRPVATRTGAC